MQGSAVFNGVFDGAARSPATLVGGVGSVPSHRAASLFLNVRLLGSSRRQTEIRWKAARDHLRHWPVKTFPPHKYDLLFDLTAP
jgi:hypothetical protein